MPQTAMLRKIPASMIQAPRQPSYVSIRYWVNGANRNVPVQKYSKTHLSPADVSIILVAALLLLLTNSGATDGDAGGKAAPPVKVVGDDDDCSHVAETQAKSYDKIEITNCVF